MMKFQIPNIWKNKIHVPNHQPNGRLINNNGDLTNNGRWKSTKNGSLPTNIVTIVPL